MYFEQFLAWFGASFISGVFTNLWEDFKDPNPEIAVAIKGVPVIEPFDIIANEKPLRIQVAFIKSVHWAVELQHRDSVNASVYFSGSGETISLQWSGISFDGKHMPHGAYYVTISARGLKTPIKTVVWLGRARDLKSGSRLIVDDFLDGDIRPYIGTGWGNYTEQSDGKNGKTVITHFTVATEENPPALHWAFRLDGSQQIGFNPYAALEWNYRVNDSSFTLAGLDTIVFFARSASPLQLSVQIVTSDIGDYTYFEDSVALDNQTKEHRLAINEFKQRLGGSGRTLDLSKCTSIRFQIQGPDGMENEIIMEKMLFAGDLASLYASPPPYVPPEPGIRVRRTSRQAMGAGVQTVTQPNRVVIELPSAVSSATLEVVSVSGRRVRRTSLTNSRRFVWDYTGLNGTTVAPGCYIAVVRFGSNEHWLLLRYLP